MKKRLVAIFALLILLSFAFALFHAHADGEHQECALCRLVQYVLSIFVPLAVFIITLSSARFFPAFSSKLTSLLLALKLHTRAPPALS